MRAQSWILIIIALGCGLVASIGISQVIDRGGETTETEVEMESIFVALQTIPVGDPITSQMIKLEKWPKDKVPEGAITKLEDVEKRRPRSRIFKGEPILAGKLIGTGDDEGPQPTPGYRALSVTVTQEDIVGGLIKPGDRVDIMGFFEAGGRNDIKETTIRTFLKDVKVFAVDSAYERDPEAEGKATMAKTVTLEVKPSDVRKIVFVQQVGKIRLTLRGTKETAATTDKTDTDETKFKDIFGEGKDADEAKDPPSPTPAPTPDQVAKHHDIMDVLDKGSQAVVVPPTRMKIIEPTVTRIIEWHAGSDTPIEVTGGPPAAAAGPNLPPSAEPPYVEQETPATPAAGPTQPNVSVDDLLSPETPD